MRNLNTKTLRTPRVAFLRALRVFVVNPLNRRKSLLSAFPVSTPNHAQRFCKRFCKPVPSKCKGISNNEPTNKDPLKAEGLQSFDIRHSLFDIQQVFFRSTISTAAGILLQTLEV